jgi:hypothetical protein
MPDDETFTFTITPGDRLPDVQWQLSQAITEMANSIAFDADGEIRLQKRLRDAYTFNLATLSAKDFPDDLRPAFESIRDRMTSRAAIFDEGTISATVMRLPDSDVKQLIADIVSLFGDVCEAIGKQ